MNLPRRHLPGLLLAVAVVSAAPQDLSAQGASELETLKSAVSDMEQTISELKEKIRQLEQRQAPAAGSLSPKPNAASPAPPAARAVADKLEASEANRRTDDLADHGSPMRHRETIAEDNVAAPRPGNAPIDPTYAGFMPLFGTTTWIKLGGYAKLDAIMDSTKMGNPNKFVTASIPVAGDPAFRGDEEFNLHAKQTRLNFELRSPTRLGALRVFYENDFSAGGSATDMEYNLRHFYAQLANVTVGQTWSAFFDPDALPDTLDFGGPGMQSVVRQPQVRYTFSLPRKGMHLALSLEQPKSDLVALPAGASTRNPMPDFAANWRWEGGAGHVQVGGLVRSLAYAHPAGLDDAAFGWGLGLSGVLHTWGKDSVVSRLTYGDGIGRYMQDLGAANGAVVDAAGGVQTLQAWGAMFGYRHFWTDHWRSEVTYGFLKLDNRAEQGAAAYDHTHYAQANLLWSVTPNFLVGIEYLYGFKQERDGDDGEDHRLQLSLQYKLIR